MDEIKVSSIAKWVNDDFVSGDRHIGGKEQVGRDFLEERQCFS